MKSSEIQARPSKGSMLVLQTLDSKDETAIASLVFGLIEGLVGPCQRRLDILVGRQDGGDANADGLVDADATIDNPWTLGNGQPQALGALHGLLGSHARQQNGKFGLVHPPCATVQA